MLAVPGGDHPLIQEGCRALAGRRAAGTRDADQVVSGPPWDPLSAAEDRAAAGSGIQGAEHCAGDGTAAVGRGMGVGAVLEGWRREGSVQGLTPSAPPY